MDWDIRHDILKFAHYWPLPFLAFLLGSLIGFGLSYLFPTPYRAEAGLAVTYNGDFFPRNPDDYKNWYLGQLDIFVKSDEVLGQALNLLKQEDPYWQTASVESLRPTLHTYWRNAGRWRLVAQAPDPRHASQAVQAWRMAILSQSSTSIAAATRMLELSNQHNAVSYLEAQAEARAQELAAVKEALQSWRSSLGQSASQSPLSTLDRWHLSSLVARSTSLLVTSQQLSTDPPAAEAPPQAYLPWLDQSLASLGDEAGIVQKQAADLAGQHEQLTQSWNEANAASDGLSAYMTVKSTFPDNQPAQPVRMQSVAALIGGILGLIVWVLVWLGRPLRRAPR